MEPASDKQMANIVPAPDAAPGFPVVVSSRGVAHRLQAARDNSYVGTFGEAGYGIKAQQVLGQVCSGINTIVRRRNPSC